MVEVEKKYPKPRDITMSDNKTTAEEQNHEQHVFFPAAPSDIHLNVIQTFQHYFPNAVIGYSGHEVGTAISQAAVTLGAKILERHVTLDRNMKVGVQVWGWYVSGWMRPVGGVEFLRALGSQWGMSMWQHTVVASGGKVFYKAAAAAV